MPSVSNQRLASLDILRGFDLFLLVFFQPVLCELLQQIGLPWADAVAWHFDHEVWEGFRFWDLVMPLFLFMSGAAIPFSLSKYRAQQVSVRKAYVKVARRFFILFLLGMVVQGNLLTFNIHELKIYTNTLQSIAVGYAVSAVLFLNFRWRGQIVSVLLLLLAYWLPMTICGDYTLEGNLANQIDSVVLGHFRGDPSYTWLLSSLTFSVTVMLGVFAGQIIREGQDNSMRTVRTLLIVGLSLLVVGWAWGFEMPIIKRIWTCSMTLYAGGWCFLLMCFFYYVVDVRGASQCLSWLKVYGMNSIVAYMLGEVVNFRSIAESVCYGFKPIMGEYYATFMTFCNFLILFLVLRAMYKAHVFIKV